MLFTLHLGPMRKLGEPCAYDTPIWVLQATFEQTWRDPVIQPKIYAKIRHPRALAPA